MKTTIISATMTRDEDNGYVGLIRFAIENHKQGYEVTIQSDNGKNNWSYALNFSDGAGSEEEIQVVDEWLEEDDAFFEQFVIAAKSAYRE
ncbi:MULTISPECIES: hypothetical protein [Cohnella]|uniref:Uncharacterized protein n=1 Tax=Cohnella phaseoli TaxID=456490 RepID=A0A3D9JVD8_9BACL|nr:hypothetical protein [Cohnella phaseoli]RED77406.1 hypothetical protein DFP98_10917 [Cohnella phaseoli]